MAKNIEGKKSNSENQKKHKLTKFSAVLLLVGIIGLLIAVGMGYVTYSKDKKSSYFFIGFGIFLCIIYVKLALDFMSGKRKSIIGLPIQGKLPDEYYATFSWAFIVILNIIVSVPIFIGLTYFSLVISQKLDEALWSVLFVGLPYVIILLAIMSFKFETINKKVWGITCGSALGAVLNSIIILPAVTDKNIMYSSFVLFVAICLMLWLFSFILTKMNLVKNTVVFMLAAYYLWAGIIFWNESFDNSKTISCDVMVVDKWEYNNSKSGSHYLIKIDDGGHALGTDKVYVSNFEYSRYKIGDYMRLSYRQGAFGLPYIEGYENLNKRRTRSFKLG